MALSMLAFVLNDGLMKAVFDSMSIYQAIFLRGLITVPLIALLAWHKGALIVRIAPRNRLLVTLRVAAEVGATVGFLTALKHMPLANVTAILQVLPLTVTMAAALFLGEKVGWRRWLAIAIGLAGVLIIIRPGMEGFSVYSIWALVAVGCVTIREIATRKLSADLPSLPVALATAIAIGGLGAVMLPAVEWAPLSASALSSNLRRVTGHHRRLSVQRNDNPHRRYRLCRAVPLHRHGLGVDSGLLMFGEIPDMPTITGTVIIILTGLYLLHRERSVRRSVQEQAHPANQDRD
ncbi:MAG: membrane protein [Alphaproteobacteria bacterium]|nr:MAG: membrane protein [Alphaproteobacteria bacterium]